MGCGGRSGAVLWFCGVSVFRPAWLVCFRSVRRLAVSRDGLPVPFKTILVCDCCYITILKYTRPPSNHVDIIQNIPRLPSKHYLDIFDFKPSGKSAPILKLRTLCEEGCRPDPPRALRGLSRATLNPYRKNPYCVRHNGTSHRGCPTNFQTLQPPLPPFSIVASRSFYSSDSSHGGARCAMPR